MPSMQVVEVAFATPYGKWGLLVANITVRCPLISATGCDGKILLGSLPVGHLEPFKKLYTPAQVHPEHRPQGFCPKCGVIVSITDDVVKETAEKATVYAKDYLAKIQPKKEELLTS